MSFKTIERAIRYCDELLAAFKHNDKNKAIKWLKLMEYENNSELESAKEFKEAYILSLHGGIAREIAKIKQNINNPAKAVEIVSNIKRSLSGIKDQRAVRDELINNVIAPIMKSWGYKKKARAFIKKENRRVKKVNVFTSQFVDYYDVKFIFEISIIGKGVNVQGHRVKELWFELGQNVDIQKLILVIRANLLRDIKPYLDSFK
jgi:hypothetical protein